MGMKRRHDDGTRDQRRIAKVQCVLPSGWRAQNADMSGRRIHVDPSSFFMAVRGISRERVNPCLLQRGLNLWASQ